MAPSNATFSKDEKVLCFHQELLYEANILDVQLEDPKDRKGPYKYKVHYRGWKKTWDGWVPQDRLRKWNEENHELAKTLKKEMDSINQQRSKTTVSSKKRGDVSARDSEERNIAGRKRGRDYDTEKEEAFQSKPAVRIIMPDVLKSILVDDWENITKNLQLVQVPAKEQCTVAKVMNDYYEIEKANRGEHSAASDILEEVVSGTIEYFNKSLGRLLLYRFERGQYEDILARVHKIGDELEGKPLAEVYGCEHLLRLFVTLPELIAQTNMDQQSASRLREELHGLTTWLAKEKNISKYLSTPYENQGAEYQERVHISVEDTSQVVVGSQARQRAPQISQSTEVSVEGNASRKRESKGSKRPKTAIEASRHEANAFIATGSSKKQKTVATIYRSDMHRQSTDGRPGGQVGKSTKIQTGNSMTSDSLIRNNALAASKIEVPISDNSANRGPSSVGAQSVAPVRAHQDSHPAAYGTRRSSRRNVNGFA